MKGEIILLLISFLNFIFEIKYEKKASFESYIYNI